MTRPPGIDRGAWWSQRRALRREAIAARRRGGRVTITVATRHRGEIVGYRSTEATP